MHRWTSAIDGIEEVAVREWGKRLEGLTGEQIRHGLDAWEGEWPPTADEFRQCCLGATADWEHKGAAYRLIDKSHRLENTASPETARANLAKMRAALGIRRRSADDEGAGVSR